MYTDKEYLFEDYIDNSKPNEELKNFYNIINEDELIDIINENKKRYNDIDLLKIENLSHNFDNIVNEIKKVYAFIFPEDLLNNNIDEAIQNKKMLDLIYDYLEQLYQKIEEELKQLEKENNARQNKIKNMNYSGVDKKTLAEILSRYNDIVLYNSVLKDNVFDNYKVQLNKKKKINELCKLINLEVNMLPDSDEICKLNEEIEQEIKNTYDRISYLEDLMMEKSKYENELFAFKKYFMNLIAYDDNNYREVNRVHNLLCRDLHIKSLLNYFEESFVKEIEDYKNEAKFIYEKYGIKNIKSSLNYISANYMDFISGEDREEINSLYDKLNDVNYCISKLYKRLNLIVKKIWKNSITNVHSYNEKDDFCFMCTNNQFIDEKHQVILITKKMLQRVTDYSEYQIGFICEFNNNILYITENEDIMSVKHTDMSDLKTPKQIEQEFLNFKVCNRIALNGFITKISAVYFISDGDLIKYKKAVELANQYHLPLITLKKDKN